MRSVSLIIVLSVVAKVDAGVKPQQLNPLRSQPITPLLKPRINRAPMTPLASPIEPRNVMAVLPEDRHKEILSESLKAYEGAWTVLRDLGEHANDPEVEKEKRELAKSMEELAKRIQGLRGHEAFHPPKFAGPMLAQTASDVISISAADSSALLIASVLLGLVVSSGVAFAVLRFRRRALIAAEEPFIAA